MVNSPTPKVVALVLTHSHVSTNRIIERQSLSSLSPRRVAKQHAERINTKDCGWKVAAVGLNTILRNPEGMVGVKWIEQGRLGKVRNCLSFLGGCHGWRNSQTISPIVFFGWVGSSYPSWVSWLAAKGWVNQKEASPCRTHALAAETGLGQLSAR